MSRTLLAFGLLALVAGLTSAQDTPAEEKSADAFQIVVQAHQMSALASKLKSPEAHIAAGSLFLEAQARAKAAPEQRKSEVAVVDENGQPVAGAKADVKLAESFKDLADSEFEAASALGVHLKASRQVDEMVKLARTRDYSTGARGAIGGAITRIGILPGNVKGLDSKLEQHHFTFVFQPGVMAGVGFKSDSSIRVTVKVHGTGTVLNVTEYAGQATWVPKPNSDGIATITIHNPHKFPARYTLVTN